MAILCRAAAEGRPASPYPTMPASVSMRIKHPSPTLSSPMVLIAVILTILEAAAARVRKLVSHAAAGIARAHFNRSRLVTLLFARISILAFRWVSIHPAVGAHKRNTPARSALRAHSRRASRSFPYRRYRLSEPHTRHYNLA